MQRPGARREGPTRRRGSFSILPAEERFSEGCLGQDIPDVPTRFRPHSEAVLRRCVPTVSAVPHGRSDNEDVLRVLSEIGDERAGPARHARWDGIANDVRERPVRGPHEGSKDECCRQPEPEDRLRLDRGESDNQQDEQRGQHNAVVRPIDGTRHDGEGAGKSERLPTGGAVSAEGPHNPDCEYGDRSPCHQLEQIPMV